LIKIGFVLSVYRVTTEELENAYAGVQPEKSSCMVLDDTAPSLVDEIRERVSIFTGTRTLGAPLAMDLSLSDGSPASDNINHVHYWLQDSVVAQKKILDQIVDLLASDFGGAHSAFRLMTTFAVRRYGFMLRTRLPHVCRPYVPCYRG
jgi:hypothetical protein